MKKIILFMILILCSSMYAEDNYELLTFERDYDKKIEFNKFYFVHYIYFDILLPLNIHSELNYESKKKIFKYLYDNLQNSYLQQVTIKSIKPINLIIRFRPYKIKNDMSIIVYTNFDVEKKQIASIDSKPDNFYAKQYFIVENKLVPNKLFLNKNNDDKTISSFKEAKKYNDHADFILYDSNANNDKEIPLIIKQGLEQNVPVKDKIIMKLTLLEYYMMVNNFTEFDNILKEINDNIKELTNEKDVKYIKTGVEILKEIKSIVMSL